MSWEKISQSVRVMKSRCLIVGVACGLAWLAPQAANAAELLAYYPFEEDYADGSGNGNDAAPSQNPDQLQFVDGFRGKSLNIIDPNAEANSGGSVDIPIDANPSELPGVSFGGTFPQLARLVLAMTDPKYSTNGKHL